ncbi:hypothetical protein [Flavobacterium sp. UBA4197]|uniref:hypothetical protein n=1 Tax=Flavobacterium sp. UBA4197 TaxID=1946546 RepID=UPI0025810207|nr:hypothetical protein [Flavobacterium sp. UBA4197]HRB72446.1 hypothetical protein [Flavobacterium sp.]
MKLKNVLIVTGLTVVGFSLVGWNKAKNLAKVFSKMNIYPAGFRGLSIESESIKFRMDVGFINPTDEDFNINVYATKLKRINIFYGTKYLATAYPDLTSISVPAQNGLVINDITCEVPKTAILSIIPHILNFAFTNIRVEAVIQVLGAEYTIRPQN